ncbi:MAG TPA: pyridoxal phosphate-dependent aminotransferase [Terriglobales bacterium]|nr:pyridoxal phosphate-dependent aminotransferase [Terriglobales bacterium]
MSRTTELSTETRATHPLPVARRMANLGTETAFEVLARARSLEAKGRDIVHLEIGEPDFDTPENVVRAGVNALEGGWTHYTPSAGLPELRQAVADYIGQTRGVPVKMEEVVIVPGGKPMIFFPFLALVEEGDEVIYPNPGFPIYESMVQFLGARPVPVHLREDRDFRLDINEVADQITDRTKLIVLNTPHNPTGGVLTRQDVEDLVAAIGDRNIAVLSDEIYSRLIYEGEHFSPISVPGFKERTVLLDGFSKTWAMTGWRLGWGVMRPDFASLVARLMTNCNSCTAAFTQVAGIEALRGPQDSVENMRAEFQRRRDLFVERVNRIPGFSCRVPKGAFYCFPNIKATGWTSKKIADALLEDAGVAALAGTAFGAFGEGYLRFSVANSLENINTALDRVEQWAKKNVRS